VDSIKQLAADMANGYIRYLDVVNREKLVSTAKNSRVFIQEQLVRTKEDLDSAYTALVLYQESNRALMVDKQMDALVAAAGALKLQLAQATTELGLAQRDLTPGSRTVQDLQARVQQLQKQYGLLAAGDGSDTDFVLAFAKLPKIARDLSLLVRRVKTLEEVNAYLNKQFYKERVQEARELPTVQVLDEAIPAYKKTAPKRAQWMLNGFVFGLLGAILYVIGRDSAARIRNRRAAGSRVAGATP
jgi:tyrosine-protein kinase Etk/Wzc